VVELGRETASMNYRGFICAHLLAATALSVSAGDLWAHPHVLVEAKSEVVFDADGRMKSVRHVWQFDPAFSAYAIQGLDENGDGELSDAELEPLAKINVESLQEFDFFTYLAIDGEALEFVEPEEYWLELRGGGLTLFYELPLKAPVAVAPDTTLEVFDPEYFVAFNFVKDHPVTLVDAPPDCRAVYHPPGELDPMTMAMLGALPQDQRELPPELAGAAADLANIAEITCP
jgi:ABC-type uncharacterized transport system substrate-binding protein